MSDGDPFRILGLRVKCNQVLCDNCAKLIFVMGAGMKIVTPWFSEVFAFN